MSKITSKIVSYPWNFSIVASTPPPSSRGICEPGKGPLSNGEEPCPKPLTTCKPKNLPGIALFGFIYDITFCPYITITFYDI